MGPVSETNALDMCAIIFKEGNVCHCCGKVFATKNIHQKFCSHKCSNKVWREKMRRENG